MAHSRSPLRARVDHDAVAAAARLAPATWVLAGLYPSTSSAAGVGRNVSHGRMKHYQPAGSFEAQRKLTQDGVELFVRYVGGTAPAVVKPGPSVKKSTVSAVAPAPAARPAAPAPLTFSPSSAATLVLTGGPSDPAWHALRREGFGGTDAVALLGLLKKRGARHVYEEKHGNDTTVETREMRMGSRLEPVIAELFSEDRGLTVVDAPGTLVNIERPWMIGNPDRYVLDETGAVVAPLECKQRGAYASYEWQDDTPPDAVAMQAVWYMAVGGWSHAYVAGLIGGNRLATYRIERDDELIAKLVDHCGSWFQKHILHGFPPPADGLEATAKLLSGLWTAKAKDTAQVELSEAARLRALHKELTAEAEDVAARLTEVENTMRLLTGESESAESDGTTAWTWKQNGPFKPAVFAKEQPELAAQFRRTVDVLDVKALAAQHPDIHRRYLARVLRVPPKGV